MEHFLGFALPGVPYGCTYALVAVCLVLTYQATGVFNFAFGAQAYASAFVFTYLTQFHGWSGWEAFLVSVVVLGPLMGWAFDRLLFRHIPNTNSTAKMVCSLALLVGIPSLLPVIFGAQNLDATTTILPFFNPNVVYFTFLGTPINGIYLATISVTVVVLILLTVLLRYTSLGLQMRAAVESRRLVQLDGVNANGVVAVAWIVSSFMASLAGVILAPVIGAFTSDQLLHLDRDGHRRRGVGAAAIDTDRGGGLGPHRGGDDRDRGATSRPTASSTPMSCPRCHSCSSSPLCSSFRGCAAWTPAATRWPRSTPLRPRSRRPPARPAWTGSSGSHGGPSSPPSACRC